MEIDFLTRNTFNILHMHNRVASISTPIFTPSGFSTGGPPANSPKIPINTCNYPTIPKPNKKASDRPKSSENQRLLPFCQVDTNKKRDTLSGIPFGARGGSRTRTSLRTLAPEASESTNSTTRASVNLSLSFSAGLILAHPFPFVNNFFHFLQNFFFPSD